MKTVIGKPKETLYIDLNGKSNVGENVRVVIHYHDPDTFRNENQRIILDLNEAQAFFDLFKICLDEGKMRSHMKEEDEDD
jgi:hypothetical protein